MNNTPEVQQDRGREKKNQATRREDAREVTRILVTEGQHEKRKKNQFQLFTAFLRTYL